jgi:hypothetical protein
MMSYSESVLATSDADGLLTVADARQICRDHSPDLFEYLNETGSAGTVWKTGEEGPNLFIKAEELLSWLGY